MLDLHLREFCNVPGNRNKLGDKMAGCAKKQYSHHESSFNYCNFIASRRVKRNLSVKTEVGIENPVKLRVKYKMKIKCKIAECIRSSKGTLNISMQAIKII